MSRKYSEIPWKLQGMALLEEELENIKKSSQEKENQEKEKIGATTEDAEEERRGRGGGVAGFNCEKRSSGCSALPQGGPSL